MRGQLRPPRQLALNSGQILYRILLSHSEFVQAHRIKALISRRNFD